MVELIGLLLSAVTAITPVASPEAPKPGELVFVRLPGDAEQVRGWLGDEELPFFRNEKGWVGLAGIDIDDAPGAREITGVTVKDGAATRWKVPVTVVAGDYPVQHITLKDESKVHLSTEDLKRVQAESAQIRRAFGERSPRLWEGSFRSPLDGVSKGGRFGSRRVINGEPRNAHSGADYGVPKGTPVYAANGGRVVLTGEHFFAGNSVFIDHGAGLFTMYFHLDEILVKDGQSVARGDVIGKVGATGRATGPHLHFGVRFRGARVDPASLIERDIE